ncbi:hypothetical protein MSPP1_000822 [Malassezia sp. CBS 17886]|nr:hypothetical protein MSPP1_000822 [Malassezia sp. CBS 17886]
MDRLFRNSDQSSLSSQALAGVVTLLALVLAVRATYRTIRSSIALAFWLVKWSFVLYLVLLAYLWCAGDSSNALMRHGLSLVQSLVQASVSAVLPLILRAAQHDTWRPTAQSVWSQFQAGPRPTAATSVRSTAKTRPRPASRRAQPEHDAVADIQETLSELTEALGLGDLLRNAKGSSDRENLMVNTAGVPSKAKTRDTLRDAKKRRKTRPAWVP